MSMIFNWVASQSSVNSLHSLFISLNQQIKYFQNTTIPELRTQFNNTRKLSRYLAKSIFVFNSGGNDCAEECSGSVRKEKCASDEFLESLLANFTHQLKTVYNLGARKFVLFGIQALGCNPQYKTTLLPTEKCREDLNHAAITFNSLLRSSIDGMKKSLPDSNFVFVNTYGIVRNVFDNPQSYGMSHFTVNLIIIIISTTSAMSQKHRPLTHVKEEIMWIRGYLCFRRLLAILIVRFPQKKLTNLSRTSGNIN
ncbi:hypothetical protein EJ110_NYTH15737 [Nymphaea thermarum]|nr:hypothetical protein EJ110_NYTH15737 [Nymphaea thermarum]